MPSTTQPTGTERVYADATKFAKTLDSFLSLPQSHPKEKYVRQLAEDMKSDVLYEIERERYQNTLYRRLEKTDQQRRQSIHRSLYEKDKKVQSRMEQLRVKEKKEVKKINEHLGEVYQKHTEIQRNKSFQQSDEAIKLRASLLEFYKKERQRKKLADHRQVSVGTCYQDALNRLNEVHKQSEEYSKKSEMFDRAKMERNSNKQANLQEQIRIRSASNTKKLQTYQNNCEILQQKESKFIQTYGRDLDSSNKAFVHKRKSDDKTKERLQKFFRERKEKWASLKHRVDERNSEVPQKCLNILDKTTNASFRQTISSFRNSSRQWYDRVQENKFQIYDQDEAARDKIIQGHLDMQMRNTCSFRIRDEMSSMRDRAKVLAVSEL